MVDRCYYSRLSLFLVTFLIPTFSSAQCIVINEIMINAPGGAIQCDGSCSPNTGEWIELYNTCSQPVNIGCYVISDGDFTVTIPSGTILAGHDYFVIGSTNSVAAVDLYLGNCNCTSGTGVGIFTNTDEQLLLMNPSGLLEDAIYWGSGQFPVAIIAPGVAGCSSMNIGANSANANFEHLPGGGSDGCSIARICDGVSPWVQRCGATVTANQTNGISIEPDFATTETTFCPGTCVDFTDESNGLPTGWTWYFPGSNTSSSVAQNPTNICYPAEGEYDVTLEVTGVCGTASYIQQGYITVISPGAPIITASGPLSFCSGGSVTLTTASVGSYQWSFNGAPIPGATNQQYVAGNPGSYSVTVTSGFCTADSDPVDVSLVQSLEPVLAALGSSQICQGETVSLSPGTSYSTYQWMFNGNIIQGAVSDTYSAAAAGTYSVNVSNGLCTGTSNNVLVTVTPLPSAAINANGSLNICEGDAVVLDLPSGFSSYQWLMNGVPVGGATGQSLSATDEGTYTATIASGTCHSTTAGIALTVVPLPVANIQPQGTLQLCEGSGTLLTAFGSVDSYQWQLNGVDIAGEVSSSLEVDQAGEYSVHVNNGGVCFSNSNTVTVEIINISSPQIVSSENNFEACDGQNLSLSVPDIFNSYQWFFNTIALQGAISNSITPLLSGTYFVVVGAGVSCTAQSASVDVEIYPIPQATLSISGTVVQCSDDAIQLQAGGGGAYQWFLNGIAVQGAVSSSYSVTVSGHYSVQVMSDFGCMDQSPAVDIQFAGAPEVSINSTSESPCEGETVTLGIGNGYASHIWSTGSADAAISVTSSGTYGVTVENNAGCSATAQITLQFEPKPFADAGAAVYSDCETGALLNGSGNGIAVWSPAETLDDPAILNPIANPDVSTVYTLTVTLGNCIATDNVSVIVDCSSLYVPNSFTPNNDGVNDVFRVIGRELKKYHLLIYDRWGVLIFETNSLDAVWDGGYKGYFVPDGVYIWRIEALDADGREILNFNQSHGTVTVLR